MTYNTSIYTEQGGSVQRYESGASLNLDQGAKLKVSADATPTLNLAYPVIQIGNNTFWYSPSAASPTLSGSPGDILWQPASASTAMWLNTSDGTAGSVWTAVRLAAAGSQTTA